MIWRLDVTFWPMNTCCGLEEVIDLGAVVAVCAADDILRSPFQIFFHPVRIAEERPPQADKVSLPLAEDPFGELVSRDLASGDHRGLIARFTQGFANLLSEVDIGPIRLPSPGPTTQPAVAGIG